MTSEPMCGEEFCPFCPTQAEFDTWLARQDRADRRNANLILGLPEDFALDEWIGDA